MSSLEEEATLPGARPRVRKAQPRDRGARSNMAVAQEGSHINDAGKLFMEEGSYRS